MDYESEITTLKGRIGTLETAGVPFHTHTGFDMNKVSWGDLIQRHQYVHWTIPGAQAQTAGNFSVIFLAPVQMQVSAFSEVHAVAGSSGSAVTLQLEQLTGTTAPGAGNAILRTALSLKTTANTPQSGTLTITPAFLTIPAGGRVGLVVTGTLTSLSNVTVLLDLTF